jgi:NTE family protein/lysophospholipid hydrolase
VEDQLFALGSTVHPRTDLVLVHPSGAPRPTTTASWLEGRSVDRHHHVRRDQPADIGRLARHVTGRAIGLVLGGGGARGLAHLGVLDALEHFGVPIDSAGGTSIGAIIGAAAALGWNREERLEHVIRPLTTSGRLLRPTLPIVALSSSRRLTNMIQREAGFGPGTIEDLWLPYFCVSANLTRAEPVVHERGPLWLALRASISLPGIMPPVYADGDLLVDGGVVDNLPIDDMRRRGVGRVIAVDLHRDVDVASPAPFDPDVSGWRMLRRRFRKTDPVPNVLEITMRAKDISSLRAQRAALADRPPDLLLTPPLASTPLLDFPAAEPLIKTAREYALAQLESRAEEIGSWL